MLATSGEYYCYALDTTRSEYLSELAYYYYRAKIMGEGNVIFNKIVDSISKRLRLDAALQRTDSTMVQTNLARMSRLEFFPTTITKFLGELRTAHSITYGRLDQALRDRASASKLPSFALLERLVREQISFKDEEITVQPNPETTGTATPQDPDAHFNGHYEKLGDKANLTETCGKDTPNPKIITHVSVHPANTSDKALVTEVVHDLGNKGLEPKAMLVDNGYDSDENQQGCQELGIDFICPPSGDLPDGLGIMDFDRTEDNKITFCPVGQCCLENIVHEKFKRAVSYFAPSLCRECQHSHDCPIKITKRKARLEWDWKMPRIEARRRMFAEDKETQALYQQRAGGESIFSVMKRKLGLTRLRRRGRDKTTLSIFLAATAMNVLSRMHNWMARCLFHMFFSMLHGLKRALGGRKNFIQHWQFNLDYFCPRPCVAWR